MPLPEVFRRLVEDDVNQGARPYGTSLSAASFDVRSEGANALWASVVAHGSAGEHTSYRLRVDRKRMAAGTAVCFVQDQPVDYLNPFTGRNEGAVAPAARWYQWILEQDASYRLDARGLRQPWDGNSVENMLKRVELNVVTYINELTHASNYATPEALQSWFDHHLASSPVSVIVYALQFQRERTRWMRPLHLENEHLLRARSGGLVHDAEAHAHHQDDPIASFHPADHPGAWFEQLGGISPSFSMRSIGHEIEELQAHDGLPVSTPRIVFTPEPNGDWAWFGVRAVGSDLVIPFPRSTTSIELHIDEDGAAVSMAARHDATLEEQRRRDWLFRQQWGKWLDEHAALSDAEVADGIRRAELILAEQIRAERDSRPRRWFS